jgi:hypothetical protein
MVFKVNRAALYGGLGSLSNAQAEPAFQWTWEWDGKHWTARQDIGPGPRVGHAMAFDTARSRAVLFGGSAASSASAIARQRLQEDGDQPRGDTWEERNGGAAATLDVPAGSGTLGGQAALGSPGDPVVSSAPSLLSIRVDPALTSRNAAVPITITATLTGQAAAPGLGIALEMAGDQVVGSPAPLPNFIVPAGTNTGTTTIPGPVITSRLTLPLFHPFADVLIRATGGGATTTATLTLTFP